MNTNVDMTKTYEDVERIAFLTRSHIGDLLLMTPAIRAVREAYPKARVSVVVRSGSEDVFARSPDVDAVVTFDFQLLQRLRGLRRLREELVVIRKVRKERPDMALCFYPEDRTALWAFLSGARYRVGPRHQPFHFLLNVKVDARPAQSDTREYFLDIARAAGGVPRFRATTFDVSKEAAGWAEDFLIEHKLKGKPFLIGIHPGASAGAKIWPPEKYLAIIGELSKEPNIGVLLFQGPSDVEIVSYISSNVPGSTVVADTRKSLDRLAALMERCQLCITNDSGPRHLAASLGTPTLGLFRKNYASIWRVYDQDKRHSILESNKLCPHCPPEKCMDKIPPGEVYGSYCLREISPAEVLQKVKEIITARLKAEKSSSD
jgi:ADP-heptose:LPS heptosyltransferase